MANLLSKLRVPYSSLIMLQGVTERPADATIQLHSQLLNGFFEGQNSNCFVSDTERKQLEEKTFRQLRLREMLKEHSSKASLIVMSLPMPRQVEIVFNEMILKYIEILSLGIRVCSIVHVLAGDSHKRHASIYVGQRKSNFSADFLLLVIKHIFK